MLHCAVRVSEKEERESLHVELCVCVCKCVQVCASVCVYIHIFLLFFACAACFFKTFLAQRPARARQTRSCLESLMICNQSPSRLCSGYMSTTQTHDKKKYIYIHTYIYIHIQYIYIYTHFLTRLFLAHMTPPDKHEVVWNR